MGTPRCGYTTCGAKRLQIKTKFVTFYLSVYPLETKHLEPELDGLFVRKSVQEWER
jgi:hypothetical protein